MFKEKQTLRKIRTKKKTTEHSNTIFITLLQFYFDFCHFAFALNIAVIIAYKLGQTYDNHFSKFYTFS
jgi:hypothetical protein